MKYRILIEQDEDKMFVAEVPSLPGCISQGKTRTEAIENAIDAIKGYIESLKKHNEPVHLVRSVRPDTTKMLLIQSSSIK